jgi:hypothetical protein
MGWLLTDDNPEDSDDLKDFSTLKMENNQGNIGGGNAQGQGGSSRST